MSHHHRREVRDAQGDEVGMENLFARTQVSGRAMRDLLATRQREGSSAKARDLEARPVKCPPGR